MKKAITPLCASRASHTSALSSDADALQPFFDLINHKSAKDINVRAIAQLYGISDGAIIRDGDPLLLTRSQQGDVTPIDPGLPLACDLIHRRRIVDTPYMVRASLYGPALSRQWVFIFPTVVLIQAERISYAIAHVSPDAHIPSQRPARLACGHLRFAYPASNHQRLSLLGDISSAMDFVKSFRSDEIAELAASGFEIAPVTLASLNEDLDSKISK